MNPLIYLIQNIESHPTFPMVLGALQASGLLQETGDPCEDGLVLLHHIESEEQLDDLDESVTLELCGGLGVPVLHLRERDYALQFRSVFPAVDGSSRGRLAVKANVEPKVYTDLSEYYARFYDHPKFEHCRALEDGRLSRDRVTRQWVEHEDTADFSIALEVLDDCPEELRRIGE